MFSTTYAPPASLFDQQSLCTYVNNITLLCMYPPSICPFTHRRRVPLGAIDSHRNPPASSVILSSSPRASSS